ncbi:hypothetical protein OIO90_004173 [Microbotryomycetes sp. JL221]|nr:hypothetical protein OIO90_004173 [Microbotryomycetes sp. JL221]
MPRLSDEAQRKIQQILDEFARDKPGASLAFASIDQPAQAWFSGRKDVLNPSEDDSNKLDQDVIMWFASTTKLLTAVAALQLIDQGVIEFDTPMSQFFPQFKPPFKIIDEISQDGTPVFGQSNVEITIETLLNQTSGFGREFGPTVEAWKKWTNVGKGFVNSCKKDNIFHTPPVREAGKLWEYGNGSEWLGLLLQEATGKDLDDILREQIFAPLGMNNSGFYPFDKPEQAARLMPLRFLREYASQDGSKSTTTNEELVDQLPLLTLPRKRSDIEYPVGGGGIYSTTTDYLKLLDHLLVHYLRLPTTPSNSATPRPCILRDRQHLESIFKGNLPPLALESIHEAVGNRLGSKKPGDIDWSTAVAVWKGEGHSRGFGRLPGSVGWAGAAGTEYWMDPTSGISVVLTTNLLPSTAQCVWDLKADLERAVYEGLVD